MSPLSPCGPNLLILPTTKYSFSSYLVLRACESYQFVIFGLTKYLQLPKHILRVQSQDACPLQRASDVMPLRSPHSSNL
jgi:hypothetical protein